MTSYSHGVMHYNRMARQLVGWSRLADWRAAGVALMLRRCPSWVWQLCLLVLLVELSLGVYQRYVSATDHLRQAQQAFARADLGGLRTGCAEVRAAVDAGRPLLLPLGVGSIVPIQRVQAWAALPEIAAAGDEACEALDAVAAPLGHTAASDQFTAAELLATAHSRPEAFSTAGASLSSALDHVERVQPDTLRAEPRLVPLADLLDRGRASRTQLRSAAAALSVLPDLAGRLLGVDRPRTYLLVGQNSDEARATGGFIGTLGRLTLADGRVVNSDVRSSYDWDNHSVPRVLPPEPLQKYMNFGAWYLRDANWWIDFRTTTEQLLTLWDQHQGGADQIDGVIAIDEPGLAGLVDAVGGVDVPELGGVVDGGNVQQRLDQRRRSPEALKSGVDYQRVKTQIIGGLHHALLNKLVNARGAQLLRAVLAFGRAAQERHILMWFRNSDLEEAAAAQAWDGALRPGSGDFLGVVATSMSYGKVMPYIVRERQYTRRADGSSFLTLTYSNHYRPAFGAPWDPLVDGTWWDWHAGYLRHEQGAWLGYIRVLAPPGSALTSADGWDDQPTTSLEDDVVVFGGPILLEPGRARTVTLTYSNPTPADSPLRIFRQPGDPDS
jgi:Protein of unknown function (DUF4012)